MILFTPIVLEMDVPSHASIPAAKIICSWVWPKEGPNDVKLERYFIRWDVAHVRWTWWKKDCNRAVLQESYTEATTVWTPSCHIHYPAQQPLRTAKIPLISRQVLVQLQGGLQQMLVKERLG